MFRNTYGYCLRKIICVVFFSFLMASGEGFSKPAGTSEIKQLKNQVEALLKRVRDLEKKQGDVVFSEMNAKMASEKTIIRRTKNPLSLKISGHINRGVWIANNGANTNIAHVDNDTSPSRLIITGTGELNSDITVGATFSLGIETNSTDQIDVNRIGDGSAKPTIRQAELFIKDKRFGELYVGQGSTASDSTMEATDLSGTSVLSAGGSMSFIAGGAVFTKKTMGNTKVLVDGQNAKADRVFDGGDGLFRRNRIRYNTPVFSGLSLQLSHYFKEKNHNWDATLKYATEFSGHKFRTQIAYMQRNSLTRSVTDVASATDVSAVQAAYKQVNGSAGVLFKNGISLFAGVVNRKWNVKNTSGAHVNVNTGTAYTGKIGYQHKFFEAGITAFAFDYGRFSGMLFDTRHPNDKYVGRTFGLLAVQNLDRIATEVYLGYRQFMLSGPNAGVSYNYIKVVLMGARIKF